jgi:dihydroxyacetone kinase
MVYISDASANSPSRSIWFNALASGISQAASPVATPAVWAAALSHALSVLYTYTAARRPSRTLIDPLSAFTEAFGHSQGLHLRAAVEEAEQATEQTKHVRATAGRAAYVEQEELEKAQVPDPGACGVVKILNGLLSAL